MDDTVQEKRRSLARVLLRAGQGDASGIVTVIASDGEVAIHLLHGKIAGVHSKGALGWDLTDFLVESETVAPNVLVRMNRRAKKAGKCLEDMLVQRGVVQEEVLQRLVQVQVTETLLAALDRQDVQMSLVDAVPEPTPYLNPIPVPFLIKRSVGRREQLQALRKQLAGPKAVYDKVESTIPRVLGADRGRIELLEDTELTGADRLVYYHCNGAKTVEQLIFASCLGEFETRKSLVCLLEFGLVHLVNEAGEGQRLQREHIWWPRILRAASYLVSMALIVVFCWWWPGVPQDPKTLVSAMSAPLEFRKQEYQTTRIVQALEGYRLLRREYPASLNVLVHEGLMKEKDVLPPTRNPDLVYVRNGEKPWQYQLITKKK
jgi:hypothetical protein